MGFGHTHPDVQVQIALFSTLALSLDDFQVKSGAIEQFVQRMHTGTPQLHPLLDHYVDIINSFHKYFHPYAASAMFANAVQFAASFLLDDQADNITLTLESFANYKRNRNGLGDIFNFFIWDKFSFPDITVHIQTIA